MKFLESHRKGPEAAQGQVEDVGNLAHLAVELCSFEGGAADSYNAPT